MMTETNSYPAETVDLQAAEPCIRRHEDLDVFQLAYASAGEIFSLSKAFPMEERYSLTDQIRRSSRSVCANLAEAWRKRRYRAAFKSKLSDSEAEAAETQVWLRFSSDCGYLSSAEADRLSGQYERVIGKIVTMIHNPDPWLLPNSR